MFCNLVLAPRGQLDTLMKLFLNFFFFLQGMNFKRYFSIIIILLYEVCICSRKSSSCCLVFMRKISSLCQL